MDFISSLLNSKYAVVAIIALVLVLGSKLLTVLIIVLTPNLSDKQIDAITKIMAFNITFNKKKSNSQGLNLPFNFSLYHSGILPGWCHLYYSP